MAVKKETDEIPLPAPPQEEDEAASKKAYAEAIKRHTDIRHASAWPLHRVPLERRLASQYVTKGKTKLVLPRSYRKGEGEDKVVVKPYEDLNIVVFRWYEERVDMENCKGVNYVAKDGVIARRHEYLGPDPRVAGYQVGADGDIHIRWWDGFLKDPWIGNEKWKVEVVCNPQGEWVESTQ